MDGGKNPEKKGPSERLLILGCQRGGRERAKGMVQEMIDMKTRRVSFFATYYVVNIERIVITLLPDLLDAVRVPGALQIESAPMINVAASLLLTTRPKVTVILVEIRAEARLLLPPKKLALLVHRLQSQLR